MFMQLLANGLVTGSVIALAAAGISIVYGILRLVNFAYGDYMTFGAFTGILFNVKLGLPIVLAAVLAMAATALLSVAFELVLWRPLRAKNAGFMPSAGGGCIFCTNDVSVVICGTSVSTGGARSSFSGGAALFGGKYCA